MYTNKKKSPRDPSSAEACTTGTNAAAHDGGPKQHDRCETKHRGRRGRHQLFLAEEFEEFGIGTPDAGPPAPLQPRLQARDDRTHQRRTQDEHQHLENVEGNPHLWNLRNVSSDTSARKMYSR